MRRPLLGWGLLALAAACRVEVPPDHVGAGTVDSAAAACAGALDVDRDGWHASAAGGRDCADDDPLVGACADTGDTAEPACEAGETCDGVDEDCDGLVDDPYPALVPGAAKVVAAGRLLAAGAPALVVGEPSDAPGSDGAVALYDGVGAFVVRIVGTDQSPSFGSQVATGRDLTGDGVDDLVVAAPFATTDDGPNSGRVFVFAGPIGPETTLASAVGWFEGGELDGQPGGQLALAPDMSGDGLAELVIGYYRHTVILSGAPAPGARLGSAWATLELNTGGGAWHYASVDDLDGDARPELLVGMETYAGGAGLVGVLPSATPTALGRTWSDAAWPGLGSKLVVVDGVPWSLSGAVPVRLDTWAALDLDAVALADGGDLDGDGHADLLVELATGIVAPGVRDLPFPGHLQGDRDLAPADDLDDDGVPDLRLRIEEGAALASGAALFVTPCDADGDTVSAASGDCADDDPAVHPGAHDPADGGDQDCSGVADVPEEVALGVGPVAGLARFGRLDGVTLDAAGVAVGYGAWAGTAPEGLTGVGWGGVDAAGDALLAGQRADVAVLLPRGATGDALAAASLAVGDGVGLARSGALGTIGDFDGDGLDERVIAAADPLGHFSVVLFASPAEGVVTLDEAEWILDLSDGWTTLTLPLAEGPAAQDLDWDGRADLVAGSAAAWYGQGRVSVWSGLAPGTIAADGAALVDWYGEPAEALGRTLAVGDLDGGGQADLAIGTADGVRLAWGGSCPELAERWDLPAGSLHLVDLDGAGLAPVGLADGWLWWGGEPWRPASVVWGGGPFGLAWSDDEADPWLAPGAP